MSGPLSFARAALVALLVCGSGASRGAVGAAGFGVPGDAELREAAAAKLAAADVQGAAVVDGLAARAAEMARGLPAIEYDPALRAAALGAGIEPAFEYVRDHVRYEAYAGVLRGAAGAYRARAANGPDRALLLVEMLKAKGVPTRFARGRLSAEQAGVLFERMFEKGPAGAVHRAAAGFAGQLRARAVRDYATIHAALGGKFPAPTKGVGRDDLVAEIVPHVWVQARRGDAWVDLDSAFADATVGKRYCAVDETLETLPADAHQRATIRVIVETLEAGTLRRETVLEVTQPVVELLDKHVFLFHVGPSALRGLGQAMSGKGADSARPTLWVDGEVTGGKPVTFDDGAKAAKSGGGLGDAIGALGRDDDEPKAGAAGPVFVAEVLEVELTFPGGRAEKTTRVLVDRAGAAWRKAAAPDAAKLRPLARDAGGVVEAQTIRNIWFSAGPHDLAGYAGAVKAIAEATRPAAKGDAGAAAAKPAAEPDLAEQLWLLAVQNQACVLWAEHALIPALNDRADVRFYLDTPRVLLFAFSGRATAGRADAYDLETEIDLRRDVVRGVAQNPAAAGEVARRKVWYGVLAGALEHEVVAYAAAAGGSEGTARVTSTSAAVGERGAVAVRPADGAAAAGPLNLDADAAARLGAALAAGETLIIPRGAAGEPVGWWAIAAATGDTRAVAGTDLHGGVTKENGRTGGGSSGRGSNRVDPATGKGVSRKGAKDEYGTVVSEVSLPGGIVVKKAVIVRVAIAVGTVAAALAGYLGSQ